jgi:hypothetical protein
MRKYVIASMVAVMAFSFAAFAAQLNVTGGTLQFGATSAVCQVKDLKVDFGGWGYTQEGVGWLIVRDLAPECEGEELYARVIGPNGPIWLSADNVSVPAGGGDVRLRFSTGTLLNGYQLQAGTMMPAVDIMSVDVKLQTVGDTIPGNDRTF